MVPMINTVTPGYENESDLEGDDQAHAQETDMGTTNGNIENGA